MAVTAAMIKELRGLTGAGMSACKSVLVEADGNMEKAIELLREKGLADAVKKAGRIASEGLSYAYITEDSKIGVVVEVNSETDFVAKNEKFQNYVKAVAKQAAYSEAETIEQLLGEKWTEDNSFTVQEALTQNISIIGENLSIRRFTRFTAQENTMLISYLHAGGKVAVLLELETTAKNAAVSEAGKNVAMQIAAMSPKFVDKTEISEEFRQKEQEILTQQALNDPKNEKKPQNVIEKMVIGRLNKEFKEMCLVDQEYVKAENKESVKDYLAAVSKEVGESVTVKRFARFETGEGLEKKQEDFAKEVESAMGI